MTNRINEGFDWFPTGASSSLREFLWGANDMFADGGSLVPDVRTGCFSFGKAFGYNAGGFQLFKNRYGYVLPIDVEVADGFVGFHFYRGANIATDARPGVGFFDAVGGGMQFYVSFEQYGIIRIYRGPPGDSSGPSSTVIANSKAGSFQEDEWFHVEIYGLIDNAAGEVEVRINTVPKVQLVGADTQSTARALIDSVWIGHWSSTGIYVLNYGIDDLFMNDTAGAEMNDWTGNVRVKTQFMIADGFTDDFTIGGTSPAATAWQSVLNQSLDDSKYVYSPDIGDLELFTPDPNLNSPLVRVVQVRMALRQDDATQRVARAALRISGTNYIGSVDQYTNQTFTFYKERFELNPDTGVSFTGAEVNGLQAGLKVQA